MIAITSVGRTDIEARTTVPASTHEPRRTAAMAMAALPKAASGVRWRTFHFLPPGTWGRHLPPEVIIWSTEPLSLRASIFQLPQSTRISRGLEPFSGPT